MEFEIACVQHLQRFADAAVQQHAARRAQLLVQRVADQGVREIVRPALPLDYQLRDDANRRHEDGGDHFYLLRRLEPQVQGFGGAFPVNELREVIVDIFGVDRRELNPGPAVGQFRRIWVMNYVVEDQQLLIHRGHFDTGAGDKWLDSVIRRLEREVDGRIFADRVGLSQLAEIPGKLTA